MINKDKWREDWIAAAKSNLKQADMKEFTDYLDAEEEDDVLAGCIWGHLEVYEHMDR